MPRTLRYLAMALVILCCLSGLSIAQEAGWFAFVPALDAQGRSEIDLRFLNEKFAGEHGFIAAKDGRFIYSSTGQPVRFWAVNGPSGESKDPNELRQTARFLARYGVNLVRIHGGYFNPDGSVNAAKVQRAVEVVEAMKTEGIYTHFSIYFPLWLTPKPDTPWLKGYDGKQNPFAALYFNPDFQKVYRQWWEALLLAKTKDGKRLIDEPAVFGAEIINEDSYFFWTFAEKNIPDPQLRILEAQFGEWLKKKYGSIEAAMGKWGRVRVNRDAPAEGRVGFRPLWNIFNEKTQRDKDTTQFLYESQRAFYEQTYLFLRGLGFKGLITASNWATASPQVFGPVEKLSYTATDFIDRHGYFECNHKGDNAAWSIRNGHTYSNRSALRFDPAEPGKPKLFVHPAMDIHYDDKPSMISETTFTRPNRYRSEAPIYYAAYGALQGSDSIVLFALDPTWTVKPRFWMQQWNLMSPALMGQFPAAALMYRRGLVSEGQVLVDLKLNVNDLLALGGTPMPQDAAFDELRLKDVPRGGEIRPGNVVDPLVHYAGRTHVQFTKEPASHTMRDLSQLIDRSKQVVTASTGQLKLDYGKGVLTINAPGAQGVSGALLAAGAVKCGDVTIASDMEIGHILAVSMDDQPLGTSGRILVQVMSEEKASGFATQQVSQNLYRITNIGKDPWLAKEFSGMVAFARADAGSLKVTALDVNGVPSRQVGSAKQFKLEPRTAYYLISR